MKAELLNELLTTLEGFFHPSFFRQILRQAGFDLGFKSAPQHQEGKPAQSGAAYITALKRATASRDWPWSAEEIRPHRVKLRLHSCPLDDLACKTPDMCQFVSGFLGGVATKQFGSATVSVHQGEGSPPKDCHAIVHFAKPATRTSPTSLVFPEPSNLLKQANAQAKVDKLLSPLSQRERDILRAVGDGLSHQEIANSLGLSVRTVEGHVARIREKMGAKGNTDLVRLALLTGLAVF